MPKDHRPPRSRHAPHDEPPAADSALDLLVRSIHSQPLKLVLAITGGGSGAIGDLLTVPGGSRTVLEAIVPYSTASLIEWLGAPPEHYCHERTARAMAMAAFERGRVLGPTPTPAPTLTPTPAPPSPQGSNVALRVEGLNAVETGGAERKGEGEGEGVRVGVGVGVRAGEEHSTMWAGVGATASLASDRPKKGPHRAHVALQTAATTACWSIELLKDRRTRREEERLVARLILNAVAQAAGVPERLDLGLLEGEKVVAERTDAPPAWQALLAPASAGAALQWQSWFTRSLNPQRDVGQRAPRAIFTGSFNPLHRGHQRMAQIARQMLGVPIEWQITTRNVDKPPLDYTEMARRAAQFRPDELVWFTRAATFVEQSRIFPGATFIIGVDTALRLADPRYYGGSEAACQAALAEIATRGCRFLVFGRDTPSGFQTLTDLPLPATLAPLCQEVPAAAFREDISSTALRQAAQEKE